MVLLNRIEAATLSLMNLQHHVAVSEVSNCHMKLKEVENVFFWASLSNNLLPNGQASYKTKNCTDRKIITINFLQTFWLQFCCLSTGLCYCLKYPVSTWLPAGNPLTPKRLCTRSACLMWVLQHLEKARQFHLQNSIPS